MLLQRRRAEERSYRPRFFAIVDRAPLLLPFHRPCLLHRPSSGGKRRPAKELVVTRLARPLFSTAAEARMAGSRIGALRNYVATATAALYNYWPGW